MDQPSTPRISPKSAKADVPLRWAIFLWALVLLFIEAGVVFHLSKRSVTPVYHTGVERWLAGQSLYFTGSPNLSEGLHYFPQFVFLFLPFHFLPAPAGDAVWRLVSTSLLALALWRLVHLWDSRQSSRLFLYATLIIMIPSVDALRNGQANVIFAAFTVHAAVDLARSRWWPASLWLLGGLVAKPLGLVTILLAVLVYRALIWRLALGMIVFLVFPFLTAADSYVWLQYRQAVRHLFDLSVITENRFADLNGLLRALGVALTGRASQIVRAGAALLTAIVWWIGAKRMREPERACLLLGLATTYLMLFNPMTEENSYVIVVPVLAVYALRLLVAEGRPVLGWGLVFAGVSMGVLPEPLRRVDPTFGLWWRPIVMLLFAAVLIRSAFFASEMSREPLAASK
jgi:alpha-1,2-mannosyltransferase